MASVHEGIDEGNSKEVARHLLYLGGLDRVTAEATTPRFLETVRDYAKSMGAGRYRPRKAEYLDPPGRRSASPEERRMDRNVPAPKNTREGARLLATSLGLEGPLHTSRIELLAENFLLEFAETQAADEKIAENIIDNRYNDAQGKVGLGVKDEVERLLVELGMSSAEARGRAPDALAMLKTFVQQPQAKADFEMVNPSDAADASEALRAEFERQLATPPLYAERPERSQTPIQFYDQHWRRFADAGLLFSDNLPDSKLAPAIRVYCSRNGMTAGEHLPPPRSRKADHILATAEPGSPEYLDAAAKIAERERHRRRRAAKPA